MNKNLILKPLFIAILSITSLGYVIADEQDDADTRNKQSDADSRARYVSMLSSSEKRDELPYDTSPIVTPSIIKKLQSFGLDIQVSQNSKINEAADKTMKTITDWFIDIPTEVMDLKGNKLIGDDAKLYIVASILIKTTSNYVNVLVPQQNNDYFEILSNFIYKIDNYYYRGSNGYLIDLRREQIVRNYGNIFEDDISVLNNIEKFDKYFTHGNVKIKISDYPLLTNKENTTNLNASKLSSLIGRLPFYLIVDESYSEGIFDKISGPYSSNLRYSEYDPKNYPESFFKIIQLQNTVQEKSNKNAKLELIEATRLGNKTRLVDIVSDNIKDIPVNTSRIIINNDIENLENLEELAIDNSVIYQTDDVGEISLKHNNITLFANPDTRITNLAEASNNKLIIHDTLEKATINIRNKSEKPFTI